MAAMLRRKIETIESFLRFSRGEELPRSPLEIFLEVSNVCDLTCVMCPRFSAFNPDRKTAIRMADPGFVKPEEVFGALDPLLEGALVIHAFGYGEPTIHPSFASFLAHLSRYQALVDFFTNGMHLSQLLAEQLVALSVHHLTVSFSGSTREEYEGVYQGGNFETVLAGLDRLREHKQSRGSRFPRVHVHSLSFDHHMRRLDDFVRMMAFHGAEEIEVTPLVEHGAMFPAMAGHAADPRSRQVRSSIEKARKMAGNLGVVLYIHPDLEPDVDGAHPPPGTAGRARVPVERFREVAAGLPVNPPAAAVPSLPVLDPAEKPDEMRRRLGIGKMASVTPFVCLEPFKTLYTRRGGQVKTCCYMRDDAPALGSIRRESGEEIWNGTAFALFRSSVLAGQYPAHACGDCLTNRLAPDGHGLARMLRDYADWHPAALGYPFDHDTRAALDSARDGEQIAARLFAHRPEAAAAPDASERVEKLFALVEGVTRIETPHTALVEGWVDHVSARGIAGWAWSPVYPDLRLPLTLWRDERKIGDVVARELRPDLAAAGKGDGRFGFSFHFDDSVRWEPGADIRVRLGNTGCEIVSST